jgi:dipeptidyl aminopeptidase/acylaminoacyl peptidase
MTVATLPRRRPLWLVGLVLPLLLAGPALAEKVTAKRPLTHRDYDSWRSIQGQQLSPDGKFLAYTLAPQEGDGEVVVRNLATGAEWRFGRGSRAPQTGGRGGQPAGPRTPGLRRGGAFPLAGGGRVAFTADSRKLLFQSFPTKAERDKAKAAKAKPEDQPRNRLNLLDLASGKVTRIEGVRSFQVPEESATWVAYLREPKAADRPVGRRPSTGGTAPRQRGGRGNRPARQREYGTELVVRNLGDQGERTVADVLSFTFSKDGKSLVYAVSSKKEEANGVYALNLGSSAPPATVLKGKGRYTQLTWDEKQAQLAFLSDRDDAAAAQPRVKVYLWDRPAGKEAAALVSAATANFRKGLVISDRAPLSFSPDGGRLFFGVAPAPPPKEEASSGDGEEKVVVDLWHWKDDYIQPMQKARAGVEQSRTYRAVYHLKHKKFVQLADPEMAAVSLTADGGWALGTDDRAYRYLIGHDTSYADYFLVNTGDGSRKPLFKKKPWALSWSPGGKYLLFFDGKHWNSLVPTNGLKVVNLTKKLGVRFDWEDWDTPNTPVSYLLAGWGQGDKFVLLYDRYDIWQVAPDGSGAKNLTNGFGRKHKVQLRYVRLDPKEKAIDATKPLLLRAENEECGDTGFYRTSAEGDDPTNLIMAAKSFSYPVKAKNADVLLFTASTFYDFPDLLITTSDFKDLKKVSDANPQKSKFVWGKAELVKFKNADGVALKGVLIKPENFDANKKYPLMVYIYEKLSRNLHRFVSPAPGTSINLSYYASNGYLVFLPDIVYTVGYPGQSALKCVLPGIQAVVDKGCVDEKAIGIQGHSWGGYQIAYMVTRTTRFKAAAAGAPVANMTSAYGGIRWGTGLPRQFQYERTQSRIGGSLWQYPMRFVENSPLFGADRVQTPLLMLHNDQDDAVPWYQGIEYFLALRRLGKEVYLFNYNGEPHGLRKRVNQKDYTVRMQQFFDHYLKKGPKPEWMKKGIPYLERDKVNKPKTAPKATVAAAGG